MATVTVSRSGDLLIAIKQVSAEHARDIQREAETLQRLDHPGVVRFVDVVEAPDQGRALHTEFVSSDTWATRPITDPTCRAAAVAAVAEVVADLHDMGFAHCQIDPSHVLHGDGDRPVLCGFRLAAESTPENRRGDLAAIANLCHDPATEPGPLGGKLSALADEARAGRLDVRELARRLAMIPDKGSSPSKPTRAAAADGPGHRHKARPKRRLLVVAAVLCASVAVAAAGIRSRGQQASAPVTITDGAAAPMASPGDSVRDSVVPGADQALDGADSPIAAEDAVGTTLESKAAFTDPATGGGAASASAGAGGHATATAASPAPMIPGILGPGIDAKPSAPGATTTAASSAPMIPGLLAAEIDAEPRLPMGSVGSGTDSGTGGSLLLPASGGTGRRPPAVAVEREVGTVLEHGGRLYGVGVPGDFVETGDWDCDGEPTPAIVRPSTGDVVLFDSWPAPHQSIAMPVRWEVDSPTGAEAVAQGSCHLLRVYTSAGSRLFDPMEGQ